jgi:hypothetical protein
VIKQRVKNKGRSEKKEKGLSHIPRRMLLSPLPSYRGRKNQQMLSQIISI